jgi:toxin-antitoxin system PIN domain toxin
LSEYLCDVNVWVALAISGHSQHEAAMDWFKTVDAPDAATFCRATQQSFLRLLTSRRFASIYADAPQSNREAWGTYRVLRRDERVGFRPDEPHGLESVWQAYTERTTASPNLWMDAYLAAFAASGDMTLVTLDHAFTQFEGLNVVVLAEA